MIPSKIKTYLDQVKLPQPDSHKGQNGKLLIIGGSQLFHAASKWSLDIASKFVDMVFYSSVEENNQLIKEAKANFWNGIVVPHDNLVDYIKEADVILVGPGMERDDQTVDQVNHWVGNHLDKKWVIDAGALQTIQPSLLRSHHLITPHHAELARLAEKINLSIDQPDQLLTLHQKLHQVNILLKGATDLVVHQNQLVEITGGNAGMTKGGTGDVLAGLVAALYCTQSVEVAAVVGSYVNKKAGEQLYSQAGPYFNASQLVDVVPQVMWRLLQGKKV